jgi:uncharacterized membrane protein YphA (DoxX/SURF4 family)
MKPAEPWGSPLWAPFFIRIFLGGYFILAGFSKFNYLPDFVGIVRQFGILPDSMATIYGIVLPYIEISVGFLILSGFWSTLSGILAAILLLSYILAVGIFPYDINKNLFNKDVILFGSALSLIFSGSGAYSIDRFRKNSA